MQTKQHLEAGLNDHRGFVDRRNFSLRTVLYASLYRRRTGTRRKSENSIAASDTLPLTSTLLVLMIVGLSVVDAFFTTRLLGEGAVELNPIMNYYIRYDTALFAFIKVKMTGLCVLALIAMANHRFMGLFKTAYFVNAALVVYLGLILWELLLLS